MVGRLLYPGWPSGFLFALVVFAVFGALLWNQRLLASGAHRVEYVALVGTLLFPVALIRAFVPNTRRAVAYFFIVQFVCLIALIIGSIIDNILPTGIKEICAVFPLPTLIMSVGSSDAATAGRMAGVALVTLSSLVVLAVAIIRPLRRARLVEKDCLQTTAAPAPSVTAPHGSLA